MTREKRPAAPRAVQRVASLLTGALIVVGLSGCGSSLLQVGDSDASLAKAKPSVAFSPVQGVPQKYADKVSGQLTASVKEKGVQIVDAKDADYVVRAAYAAAPEKKGTKVTYAIELIDKAGKQARRIEGEEIVSPKKGGDSWAHVTDEAVQKVALKSAADLNAWIENPNGAQAPAAMAAATPGPAKPAQKVASAKHATPTLSADVAALPAAAKSPAPVHQAALTPKGAVAVVPLVNGAPGDGKTALSEAMKKALAQQGVKLAQGPTPGAYKVQGVVEMGAAENGQQPVTIRWIVLDPSGKQLEKTVVQNNKVAEGRLDNAWGDIADLAAGAAAVELSKLLHKSSGHTQQTANGAAG